MKIRLLLVPGLLLLLPAMLAADASPARRPAEADPFAPQPTLAAADYGTARDQALRWLAGQEVGEDALQQARQLWPKVPSSPARPLLDRLAATLALGDARVAALQDLCTQAAVPGPLPRFAWLSDDQLDPFARDNLRLYFGRWLSRNRYYDEALGQLGELEPEKVVDPASLLFHRAVCHHRLLQKQAGLAAVGRLLDDVRDPPLRYRNVAALMKQDLEQLEDESLDHAARLMDDIGRRLELGRAGRRVRKVEDDVIAMLDKLIKELEDQADQ